MTNKMKMQVGILCGGQSAEHEVSIVSAKNVVARLDKNKYEVSVVLITKRGEWFLFADTQKFLTAPHPHALLNTNDCERVTLIFGEEQKQLYSLSSNKRFSLDVVFPVLHGPNGEDGSMQGLLKLARIPYVGPDVLGSAICMDKEVAKRLLRAANILSANWVTVTRENRHEINFADVKSTLGMPLFIKPANLGSSIGMTKVTSPDMFMSALDLAFQYDNKILIEEYVAGREIEVSVLGNGDPKTSQPGEVIVNAEFYSYEAKYLDPDGAVSEIPAKLPVHIVEELQEIAKKAFKVLNCEVMARIDFFVTDQNEIYLNEVNTIPGFTEISQYPKLWGVSGIAYADLLDQLIQFALARFKRDSELKLEYKDGLLAGKETHEKTTTL